MAQEHYAAAWARQAAGSVVALRYHNVYGPGMPRDTPYAGVAALFRSSLERGEAPQVFEDGGQMRDFVHVTDVAAANLASIEAVADRRDGAFAAYNVCSGSPVSILDVARLVGSGLGVGAGGDREVPDGRRAPRGRISRPGRGRTGFHRIDRAGGGSAGVRDRAAAGVSAERRCTRVAFTRVDRP